MTKHNQIRKTIAHFVKSKSKIYLKNGNEITSELVDSAIDSTPDSFLSLISRFNQNSELALRLFEDAEFFDKMPFILYLDGLFEDAARISYGLGAKYTDMPDEKRMKLARFLFRETKERALTKEEKLTILYPNLANEVPIGTERVDWALNVDEKGLSKVIRNYIESKVFTIPDQLIYKIWQDKGWMDYRESAKMQHLNDVLQKKVDEEKQNSTSEPKVIYTGKITINNINLPQTIECLIGDVMDYIGEQHNISEITKETNKILPQRFNLAVLDYFHGRTTDADRAILLQKAFDGVPLL